MVASPSGVSRCQVPFRAGAAKSRSADTDLVPVVMMLIAADNRGQLWMGKVTACARIAPELRTALWDAGGSEVDGMRCKGGAQGAGAEAVLQADVAEGAEQVGRRVQRQRDGGAIGASVHAAATGREISS